MKAAAREAEKSQLQFREMSEQRTKELQAAWAAWNAWVAVFFSWKKMKGLGEMCVITNRQMFASGSSVTKRSMQGDLEQDNHMQV